MSLPFKISTIGNQDKANAFRVTFSEALALPPKIEAWDNTQVFPKRVSYGATTLKQIFSGTTGNSNKPMLYAAATTSASPGSNWKPTTATAGSALKNRLKGSTNYVIDSTTPGAGESVKFNLGVEVPYDAVTTSGQMDFAVQIRYYFSGNVPNVTLAGNSGTESSPVWESIPAGLIGIRLCDYSIEGDYYLTIPEAGTTDAYAAWITYKDTTAVTYNGNTNLKKNCRSSCTASANISVRVYDDFTGNSSVKSILSGTYTGDSRFNKLRQEIFLGNSNIKKVVPSTFLGKAYTKYLYGDSWTGNTNLRKGIGQSFNGDACTVQTTASTLTANSNIKKVINSTLTGNSSLSALDSGTFSGDATLIIPNTGFLFPTGTVEFNEWTNPTYAYSDDGQYTTAPEDGYHYQGYNTYGFEIPEGATIVGIEMILKSKLSANSGGILVALYSTSNASWGGYQAWNTSTVTEFTIGGSSVLWGNTWTADDFSDVNFKSRIASKLAGDGLDTAMVDYLKVKVYYTA